MSKVLIDRELLEHLTELGDEAIQRMGSYLAEKHGEQRYVDAARAILGQPDHIITDNTETLYAALAEIERLKAQADLESMRIARLLLNAGTPLSNAAYNLAQRPGRKLDQHDCDLLSDLRKRWDEAVTLSARPTE
jgi:hypothetical protein